MHDPGDLYCPFRAEVIAAIPQRLVMLIHGVGVLAMLLIEP